MGGGGGEGLVYDEELYFIALGSILPHINWKEEVTRIELKSKGQIKVYVLGWKAFVLGLKSIRPRLNSIILLIVIWSYEIVIIK